MSIESHFYDLCTTERRTETGVDGHNNPVYAWADRLVDVPCRLIEKKENVVRDDTHAGAVVSVYVLLLGAGADVLEKDRVTVVSAVDRSVSGRFLVDKLLPRRGRGGHHLSVRLKRVS